MFYRRKISINYICWCKQENIFWVNIQIRFTFSCDSSNVINVNFARLFQWILIYVERISKKTRWIFFGLFKYDYLSKIFTFNHLLFVLYSLLKMVVLKTTKTLQIDCMKNLMLFFSLLLKYVHVNNFIKINTDEKRSVLPGRRSLIIVTRRNRKTFAYSELA